MKYNTIIHSSLVTLTAAQFGYSWDQLYAILPNGISQSSIPSIANSLPQQAIPIGASSGATQGPGALGPAGASAGGAIPAQGPAVSASVAINCNPPFAAPGSPNFVAGRPVCSSAFGIESSWTSIATVFAFLMSSIF